ncbi:hypothetical protein ACU4HD_33660 [Cupriavidus basilensis]
MLAVLRAAEKDVPVDRGMLDADLASGPYQLDEGLCILGIGLEEPVAGVGLQRSEQF